MSDARQDVSGCLEQADAAEMPRRSVPVLSLRLMLAVSVAVHVGIAAVFSLTSEANTVGTGERARIVSIELVAAPAAPQASEAPLREVSPPEPAKVPPERKKKKLPAPRVKPVPVKTESPPVSSSSLTVVAAVETPARGDAAVSSAAPATQAAGRRAYGRLVWLKIAERKPAGLHLEGTAHVRFAVTAEGGIGSIEIVRSSGNDALDALALRTIRSAAPFAPPPAGLSASDLLFVIPFNFR